MVLSTTDSTGRAVPRRRLSLCITYECCTAGCHEYGKNCKACGRPSYHQMSLVVHVDSAEKGVSDEPPLSCDLKRPPTFDSYTICHSKPFTKELVLLPKGIESYQQPGLSRPSTGAGRRCIAPYPANADLIRQCYTAFMTANGISHLDLRQHSHMNGGILANGICAELQHSIELAADKATPSLAKTGPNRSQRSRAVAVTLLLPAATAGKPALNKCQIALLNALAQIAQTPMTKSALPSILDGGVPKTWPSCEEPPRCTQMVRLSVVAGKDDVASYMKRMQVKSTHKDMTWATSNALCVSYTDSKQANSAYVVLDIKQEPTVADAANSIMQALTTVQLQSASVLTLPPGMIAPDMVNLEEPGPNDHGPFLDFQADLQRKFKELHLSRPFVEIPKAALSLLLTQDCDQRFVRVCSNSQPWCEEDHRHNVGILYSSDDEILRFYLKRCRADVPRQWPRTTWPPYMLLPPEGEEVAANICVLWFKPESVHIGGDLNLFGPRVRPGIGVCEFNDCHVGRVMPNVASIERLRNAGFFVVPCTAQSVLPSYAPRTDVLWQSFREFLLETEQQIIEPLSCDTSTVVEPILRPQISPGALCHSENDKMYSSILSSHMGHPCATIGRAYEVLQQHAAKESTEGRAFHGLVSVGMLKFGESFSMEELMAVCVDVLTTGKDADHSQLAAASSELVVRSESPKKRVRPPPTGAKNTTASLEDAVVPVLDQLAAHLCESSGRKHTIGLSGMKDVAFPSGDRLATHALPIDDYDVLETVWVLLGFADVQNPSHDTMHHLKNSTDEHLKNTFNVDITLPTANRDSTLWHLAAVQACLENKPTGHKIVKDFNESFVIISNQDHSNNEVFRLQCSSNGSNGTFGKCKVVDMLLTTHRATHQRNLLWVQLASNGKAMRVACFSGEWQ